MKQHTFRDNLPKSPNVGFTPRKIGLLGIPVIIAGLVMHCSQKVNDILQDGKGVIEEFSGYSSQTEKTDIAESWGEARENQVLMIYRIKKGDTLSGIARKHGVTLESILSVNKKIVFPDAIQVGRAIIIAYDGTETIAPETFQTTGSPIPLTFTKKSLLAIMENILTRPKGKLLGAVGNQPSDIARLKVIAEKTGLGKDVPEVRYANLCAANMRAFLEAYKEYSEKLGITMNVGWSNVGSGIGVGKHYEALSAQNKLPKGYQVIATKDNPNTTKLKELLLSKGSEYSIFILSYSHGEHGHVNVAFRVGDDIIIFDPSWAGSSAGWPERFHRFEDYMRHFVNGKVTTGYTVARDRYDLYNITCVPTYRVDPIIRANSPKSSPSITTPDTQPRDMRELTMVFEGFAPRMKIDTQDKNKTTYAIGYGTNIGTKQDTYPFGSFGKDVADYLKNHGHSIESIKQIMHGSKSITKPEGGDLFELRYIPRYQKMRTLCGKNWNKYPPVIRNMLVDMSYNMGEYSIFPHGDNPGFPDAVKALNRGDWAGFVNAVVDSKYADDVGARRLGKWIDLVVRNVLHGKTSGLSQEALHIRGTYNAKHSRDINKAMVKKD